MFRALVVVATGAYVYAQSLTSECINAGIRIAADPAASTCLNTGQLLPIVVAIQNNASVIPTITNWLSCLCCQPACSNDSITAIHNLFVEQCPHHDWRPFDPMVYPIFRQAACLKNANGTLCFLEYLKNVEAYSGTLIYEHYRKIVQGVSLTMYPANISCTDCNKARYNIEQGANLQSSATTSADPAIQSLCGAAFVDGQMPTGITQSANNSTSMVKTTLNSLALSLFSQSLIMVLTTSAFVVVSTMYSESSLNV